MSISSASDGDVTLFYAPTSSYSRKALVALYEKKVDFNPYELSLANGDQYQEWYLLKNPLGEVPTLEHKENIIPGSGEILEYVDRTFGRPHQLFPANNDRVRKFVDRIDAVSFFKITYGILGFHAYGFTEVLRYPFHAPGLQERMKASALRRPRDIREKAERVKGSPAEDVLKKKAEEQEDILELFLDRSKYLRYMRTVEDLLDELEEELADDERSGPWLCGPVFSAADIVLTNFLIRLYQLGLDDKYWKGGERPNLSVYQELAFRRPSVKRATEWEEHKDEYAYVKAPAVPNDVAAVADSNGTESDPSLDAAKVGLAAVLAIGGIYACKKLLKK